MQDCIVCFAAWIMLDHRPQYLHEEMQHLLCSLSISDQSCCYAHVRIQSLLQCADVILISTCLCRIPSVRGSRGAAEEVWSEGGRVECRHGCISAAVCASALEGGPLHHHFRPLRLHGRRQKLWQKGTAATSSALTKPAVSQSRFTEHAL